MTNHSCYLTIMKQYNETMKLDFKIDNKNIFITSISKTNRKKSVTKVTLAFTLDFYEKRAKVWQNI